MESGYPIEVHREKPMAVGGLVIPLGTDPDEHGHMYVIILNYVAPLERVDEAIPAHLQWLDEHYDAGHFLASGRREPRTGGVILARDMPPELLAELVAADPFARLGLAHHEVIRFDPSKCAHELEGLLRPGRVEGHSLP